MAAAFLLSLVLDWQLALGFVVVLAYIKVRAAVRWVRSCGGWLPDAADVEAAAAPPPSSWIPSWIRLPAAWRRAEAAEGPDPDVVSARSWLLV
jgi:hypothetical protein